MSEGLAYLPPKSVSFGHAARTRNALVAWKMTQDFLATHCIASLRNTFDFRVWTPNEWTETEPAIVSLEAARARLGPEKDVASTVRSWSLPSDMLQESLDLFFASLRLPRQQMGPVAFNVCFDLQWRALPGGPSNGSRIGVFFDSASSVFLQPHFIFPFAW